MRTALLLLACAAVAAPAADDARDAGRAALDKYREAIVTIRVVAKIHISAFGQNQDQERKFEVGGTIIDPDGLVVASAAGVDPGAAMQTMLAAYADKKMQLQAHCDVKETTLILDDGAEVEADVVLKDGDLDLAFLKPRDARKFTAIELKAHAAPRPLDPVFALWRLGKNVNRAPGLALGEVCALVKGPQPYVIATLNGGSAPGSVVFAADGAPLGVVVIKQAPAEPGGGGMGALVNIGGGNQTMNWVIRPCDAVLALAAQAKQAKPPEKAEDKTVDDKAASDAKPDAAAKPDAPAQPAP